jgi:hypothetical protein
MMEEWKLMAKLKIQIVVKHLGYWMKEVEVIVNVIFDNYNIVDGDEVKLYHSHVSCVKLNY